MQWLKWTVLHGSNGPYAVLKHVLISVFSNFTFTTSGRAKDSMDLVQRTVVQQFTTKIHILTDTQLVHKKSNQQSLSTSSLVNS